MENLYKHFTKMAKNTEKKPSTVRVAELSQRKITSMEKKSSKIDFDQATDFTQ